MPAITLGNCTSCNQLDCSKSADMLRKRLREHDSEEATLLTRLQIIREKRSEIRADLEEYLQIHSLKGSQKVRQRTEVYRGDNTPSRDPKFAGKGTADLIADGLRANGADVQVIPIHEPGHRNWAKIIETIGG